MSQFGLTEDQFSWILNHVVGELNTLGAEVYCFGSRARGDNQPYSDLDLMVVSEIDLSREVNSILEKIIDSNFPFVVDLVEERHFAASYMPNYQSERVRYCRNKFRGEDT